jgi:hypothetical protein
MMASIIDEAGARIKEEVESLKQLYNKKLEVLVHDMKKMEDVGNSCTQNRENYIMSLIYVPSLSEIIKVIKWRGMR